MSNILENSRVVLLRKVPGFALPAGSVCVMKAWLKGSGSDREVLIHGLVESNSHAVVKVRDIMSIPVACELVTWRQGLTVAELGMMQVPYAATRLWQGEVRKELGLQGPGGIHVTRVSFSRANRTFNTDSYELDVPTHLLTYDPRQVVYRDDILEPLPTPLFKAWFGDCVIPTLKVRPHELRSNDVVKLLKDVVLKGRTYTINDGHASGSICVQVEGSFGHVHGDERYTHARDGHTVTMRAARFEEPSPVFVLVDERDLEFQARVVEKPEPEPKVGDEVILLKPMKDYPKGSVGKITGIQYCSATGIQWQISFGDGRHPIFVPHDRVTRALDTGFKLWVRPHDSSPCHGSSTAPISPKVDAVNHPSHYTQGKVECIDAIESALSPAEYIGFLRGQVIKYQWRCGLKDAAVQEAAKANWYGQRLEAFLKKPTKA